MNAPATVQPSRSFSWRRVLGWSAGGLVALVVAAALAGWLALRGSLPQLEGTATLAGLGAPVTVMRDAAGTPTVVATSREDIAYALGYLHGQERFFQMDLQRRAPAGELAALLGPKLLDTDRKFRPHGLRAVARQVVAAATPAEQRLLDLYTAGVNAGLGALHARPWEYLLLQQPPRPWLPEDTVLTAHAMFLTLQDSDGSFERQRAAIHTTTPGLEEFLYSPPGEWQAPLFGAPLPAVPVPVAALQAALAAAPSAVKQASFKVDQNGLLAVLSGEGAAVVGSNNWALAGKHTASGGALVADDMHLAIRVPNIWYRVRLETRDAAGALRSAVTGVSLPGSPLVVAGSNGRIAWGFTNSNIDSTDAVVLVPDPAQADHYLTATGSMPLQKREEVLEVRGGKPVKIEVITSEFGPVLAKDADGRRVAVQWVPHFAGGTNLKAIQMMEAQDVAGALAVASGAGMPTQNLTVGDSSGQIAWTLMGQVPQRLAPPIALPRLSTDPAALWAGVGPVPAALARINPADGRIWTANARIGGMAGEGVSADDAAAAVLYAGLGSSTFDRGARTKQIRDGLLGLEKATPADFLKLHLDDRAVFVQHWQPVALRAAEAAQVPAATRALLAAPFTAASVESVTYRLVRAFHRELTKQTYLALTAAAQATLPELEFKVPPEFEGALWQLVSAPAGTLPAPGGKGWDAFLGAVLKDALKEAAHDCGGQLAGCNWGRANTAKIRHPLSAGVPGLGRLVDMPANPLPGDGDMPRVQRPEHGASQRFAVTPGREAEGYLEMPGGNAGNPLSPYYGAGHADWEQGVPTPFLPGATRWTLQLKPSAR